MKKLLFVVLPFAFISCITPPILSEEGSKIIILSGAAEIEGYKVIDVRSATYNQEQGAAGSCVIELKNIAASLGADAIRVISTDTNEYQVVTVTVEILKEG